jgi:hypothetical protein
MNKLPKQSFTEFVKAKGYDFTKFTLNTPELRPLLLEYIKYKKEKIMHRFIKQVGPSLLRLSPYLVLLSGSIWIAWILFNPPLYVIWRGGRRIAYNIEEHPILKNLYPVSDYTTAILHSMGVAVIAGVIFYLLKKVVSTTEKK